MEEEPDNREAMEVLGRLYEEAEQFSELLALRRRQLDLLNDGEARLAPLHRPGRRRARS